MFFLHRLFKWSCGKTPHILPRMLTATTHCLSVLTIAAAENFPNYPGNNSAEHQSFQFFG